jgi:MFS family permease
MFWCGLAPVVVAVAVLLRVKEPERWQKKAKLEPQGRVIGGIAALRTIFKPPYTRRTVVNAVLLTAAICGLWAGTVYAPTAVIDLAKRAGMVQAEAVKTSSLGMGLLSLGTILGCLAAPVLAERIGRKKTLAAYFLGMAICILLGFGWAFYLRQGLHPFIAVMFFLGFFGGNFAIFSLWLPEQYGTTVRVTAFAFATSFGRFIAAGVNFGLGAMVSRMGTLGKPVALTAIAFAIGLLAIPFAVETRGNVLPD